jgi:hypothetical protein
MGANANGWHGPPMKADDEATTGRLREKDIVELRAEGAGQSLGAARRD